MSATVSVERAKEWVDEAERLCAEAEQLVIAEGGSAGARCLLGMAMLLRDGAMAWLEKARGVS